jgi:hypothetical protein
MLQKPMSLWLGMHSEECCIVQQLLNPRDDER